MKRVLCADSLVGRSAVIAAVFLTLALGLCVFDRDGDGVDDHGLDICAMLIATAVGTVLLVAPDVTGWSTYDVAWSAPVASPHPPHPPPKPALGA